VIRGACGLLLRGIGFLVAGCILAVILFVLRMTSGPLPLNAVAPLLAGALSADDGSFVVHVGHTELALADRGASLEILASEIRIDNRDGSLLAGVPEIAVGINTLSLLHGIVAPTRIVVTEPRLHLVRDSGGLRVAFGDDDQSGSGIATAVLDDLMGPPDQRRFLASLREISLRDASLVLEDRYLGAVWRTRRAAASIRRVAGGFAGDASLAIEVDDSTAELQAGFRYAEATHLVDLRIDIAQWDMAKLTRIAPPLKPLAALHAPVGGSLQLALDVATQRIAGARVDLTVGAGSVDREELPGGTSPIAGAQIRASYDPSASRIILEKLALDFGGPVAQIKGAIDGVDLGSLFAGALPAEAELRVDAKVEVDGMPANSLDRYWPPDVARNARAWVTANIRDGVIDQADLATKLRLHASDLALTGIDAFGGSLRMHGLTVNYRAPLPAASGVGGAGSFDQTQMVFHPTSGSLKGLHVSAGTVVITDLEKIDQYIDIALDVDGPIRDALEVLDSKPFQYAQQIGLDPSRVDGAAAAHVNFKFMLDHRTTFDDVAFGAQAALSAVALRKIVFDRDLSDGNLQLRLDREALRLDGTAQVAGVPATLGWLENFKPRNGVRSRYTVKGRIDERAMHDLLPDLSPDLTISGAADLDATITNFAAAAAAGARKPATAPPAGPRTEVALQLDLKDAAIAAPNLNWTKPAGARAAGGVQLDIAGGNLTAVRQATLAGDGIDLRLSAAFGANQALQSIEIGHLQLGGTNLAGAVARRSEGGWRAEISGASLDATALMDGVMKPGSSVKKDQPPLLLDAKLQSVLFGPRRDARDVRLKLFSDGKHWQSISLDLAPFGAGSLSLRFGESGGERPFTLAASDLGALLRLLDISDHVSGGPLTATGRATDAGDARIIAGHFEGGDYNVTHAPVLAKLLAVASFSGIASLLQGEGIPFSRLSGDFSLQDGIVTLRQGRTYGGAIGINASGILDIDKNAVDLTGTLVPAYTLNSILGYIPLVGNLLQGGAGQGLFAASFHASGPLDDPSITVNPLTALAPGFLRNLFLQGSAAPTAPPNEPKGGVIPP
jgi:hypothetical protein